MPDIMEWPALVLPFDVSIMPPKAVRGTSASISGSEQISAASRAPFRMSLIFKTLTGAKVLAWRAMLAHLEGGAGLVRLPLFDKAGLSDAELFLASVPHSDGTSFSDGTLYASTDISGVTVSVAAGMRVLTVDLGAYGPILQAGHYFGLGDDPHIATSVIYDGTIATVKFRSDAKRAHVAAPFRLRPTMIARLADPDSGELPLEMALYGAPSIDLVEVVL